MCRALGAKAPVSTRLRKLNSAYSETPHIAEYVVHTIFGGSGLEPQVVTMAAASNTQRASPGLAAALALIWAWPGMAREVSAD
jgi:hypothetical protein